MSKSYFEEREHALEEMFFRKKEAELLARLRQKDQGKKEKDLLAQISGIQDQKVLEHVVELGIKAETFAAISLVPLIEVAWADLTIETKEKETILLNMEARGIGKGTPAYQLLEGWLEKKPDASLYTTWTEYIKALKEKMGKWEMEKMQGEIMGQAILVAESSREYVKKGAISAASEKILNRLEDLFESEDSED